MLKIQVRARGIAAAMLLGALSCAGIHAAETVRVIRFAEGKPFQMGTVTSRRIVHPGIGAKKTTLNYSVSMPGDEFAQHVHDYSDDTILVLKGEVNLRQGDTKRLFREGECAFVPTGQIHGTVTAGTGEAIMISFQNPPDLVLYTGARDSSKPGAAQPKGVITPGAVKYLNYDKVNGIVTSPAMGSERGAFAHRKMKPSESFHAAVEGDGERVLFVKSGAIRVKDATGSWDAGEKDAVFLTGGASVDVTATSPATVVIDIQAPLARK